MFGMMQRRQRPEDRFAFEDDAPGMPPTGGAPFAFAQPAQVAAPPPPGGMPAATGAGGTDEIMQLVKALMEAKRAHAAEIRGRQFGDVAGLNAGQRALLAGPGNQAEKAATVSSFTAANRRAALRAAGIDPDAPGASNVAFTGKTPEQYAADVRKSIEAEEQRRMQGRDRLLAKTAEQRRQRQARAAPPVNLATTPEELALLQAMTAA